MKTTEITVSKREFIFACLWACRHGRPEQSVYVDPDGSVFLEPHLEQSGSRCVNLGSADVSAYCDDVESDSAIEQVLECMDMNGQWREISDCVEMDDGNAVSLTWVD